MQDYDDYPQDSQNPFRRRGFSGLLNGCIFVLARAGQRLLLPIHGWMNWLGRLGGRIAFALENRLGRLGAWVAQGWWRVANWLRLDAVRRQVNTLQDTAVRSVDGLTTTVRERTTQASWVRRLSLFWMELTAGVSDRWIRFLAWAERSWLTRQLARPLRWTALLSYAIGDFLIGWVWTRQYRHLLFGIPAILLVMPLAYCAVRLPFYTAQAKARHYRSAVREALAVEDYETAELYFRKLAQLGDVHEQVVLRSALLAEEQGQIEDAYRQMLQIAPEHEPGVAQAHLWIAQRISAGDIEVDNPRASELVATHVNHALSRGESDPLLNIWLAQIYLQTGQRRKCLEVLEQTELEQMSWQTRVVAADMYAALGHLERAQAIAIGAYEFFERQRDEGASQSVDDYLRWAVAAQVKGNPNDALDVLESGLQTHSNAPRLLEAIGQIGLAYFDSYPGSTAASWDARYEILQRLVAILPDSEPVLQRLAEMTLLPALVDRAAKSLEAKQADGTLPPTVEKTLGDAAVVRNDLAAARRHYQSAIEQDPTAHGALNNLAYLLANDEPRDLAQALQLSVHATELAT